MRVVSLLPSATEILDAIGGITLLVGKSHECDHPAEVARLPVLTASRTRFTTAAAVDREVSAMLAGADAATSLYHLDTDRLRDLRPDVILTQDLCRVCSIDLAAVRGAISDLSPRPNVVSLNPTTFEGMLDDAMRIGAAVGLEAQAREAVVRMRERFHAAADHVNAFTDPVRVLFMEWTDPVFVGGHWTPQLIERAGGAHTLNPTRPIAGSGDGAGAQGAFREAGPSRRVTAEEIVDSAPEVVIIAPCGLALDEVRAEARTLMGQQWFQSLPAARGGRIALVDGNQMFNRPGPRLVDAFEFLVGYLNHVPGVIPADFPWEGIG
jgi:ABC-type Fe3+-hydroxamate transport system substrate-binding protein